MEVIKVISPSATKLGETYSIRLTVEENILVDQSCTCRYMSFDFWSKKNQERGTLCRHIIEAVVDNGVELPEKYKTPRNLTLIQAFKTIKSLK